MRQQILNFLLKNWKEITLVILLFVVFAKNYQDTKSIVDAHKITQNSLEQQIKDLKQSHETELRLRDEALERYWKEMEDLQRRYDEKQKEIDRLTEEQKEAIIREFENDRQKIIDRFVNTYGIRYVE